MPQKASVSYLPADSMIARRIEETYSGLSPALRSFADFVLSEPMKVAQLSINETVSVSGVSVASANRFARKLGFEGYAQFRSDILRSFEDVLAPVERLRREVSSGTASHDILIASLQEDMDNIANTIAQIDRDRIEQAVAMILGAARVFVVGFDNAAALARLFSDKLAMSGIDARTVESGGRATAGRKLSQFGSRDLVISISFPRYMRDTLDVTEAARRHRIPILAVTDNQSSPLAALADLSLYVGARRTIGSTSDAAILAFLDALSSAVTAQRPGAMQASKDFADFAFPWLVGRGGPRD